MEFVQGVLAESEPRPQYGRLNYLTEKFALPGRTGSMGAIHNGRQVIVVLRLVLHWHHPDYLHRHLLSLESFYLGQFFINFCALSAWIPRGQRPGHLRNMSDIVCVVCVLESSLTLAAEWPQVLGDYLVPLLARLGEAYTSPPVGLAVHSRSPCLT